MRFSARIRWRRGAAAACAAVGLWCSAAAAQTDLSIRMRGMSAYLAGLTADPITDAALNPASLEALAARTAVYTAVPPDRSTRWSYPGPSSSWPVPSENPRERPTAEFYTPYTVALYGPFGGAYGTVTVEAFTDDNESLYQDWDLETGSTLYQRTDLYGNSSERQHLLADGALAWDTGTGLRATLSHDRTRPGHVDTRETTRIRLTDGETERNYDFYRTMGENEILDAALTGGFFRAGQGLAHGVVGLAFVSRTSEGSSLRTSVIDEDVDGNGSGIGTAVPLYAVSRTEHTTTRDYSGGRAFLRMLGRVKQHVRYRVEGGAEYTAGDGDAEHTTVDSEYRIASTVSSSTANYTYDGREKRYYTIASIAYGEDILPELLTIAGAYATWKRVDFAEDGTGEIHYADDASGIPVDETAPYFQRALVLEDVFRLVLPLAAEWRPVGPLALRTGIEMTAERIERESSARVEVESALIGEERGQAKESQRNVDSNVFARLNFGVGVALGDRFFLDLGRFHQSNVDLASYTHFSAMLRF